MTHFTDVQEFHRVVLGSEDPERPTIPPDKVETLRWHLIDEEVEELAEAMEAHDLPAIAKEIADVLVVVYGTAAAYGIDIDRVWEVVHASNMAKAGGPRRADGKALKPEGWTPPDVAGVLGL